MLRALTLFLLIAASPEAQTLVVETASPADYSTGVATDADVSLTFSEPLAEATAPTIVVLPAEASEVTSSERSEDGRTLSLSLSLQPDQRYVVLVLGARSASGDALARPFALNLSTGGSGFVTVTGQVADAGGGSVDGTLVALVTGDLSTGAVEIVAVDVVEVDAPEAAYSLGPVGLGIYTAGAVRLPLPLDVAPTPEAIGRLAYGLYDPDGDGTPNPIFSTSGVDIGIAPPTPTTASAVLDDALATASGVLDSPSLVRVLPTPVTETGGSAAWRFTFQSDSDAARTDVVQVGPFGFPIENAEDVIEPPLPVPFVDSDAALQIADDAGGAAFRASNASGVVVVTLRAGATVESPLGEWVAEYRARDTADGPVVDALDVAVPFAIADAVETTAESQIRLRHRGAHPSRSGVSVWVDFPEPGAARVDLFDARGRRVALLHDGPLARGASALGTFGSLPPGVYLVRLTTPEATRVLRAVVAR